MNARQRRRQKRMIRHGFRRVLGLSIASLHEVKAIVPKKLTGADFKRAVRLFQEEIYAWQQWATSATIAFLDVDIIRGGDRNKLLFQPLITSGPFRFVELITSKIALAAGDRVLVKVGVLDAPGEVSFLAAIHVGDPSGSTRFAMEGSDTEFSCVVPGNYFLTGVTIQWSEKTLWDTRLGRYFDLNA